MSASGCFCTVSITAIPPLNSRYGLACGCPTRSLSLAAWCSPSFICAYSAARSTAKFTSGSIFTTAEASPRLIGPPSLTSATSPIRMGTCSRQRIGVAATSSRVSDWPWIRSSDSFSPRSITPPPASTLAFAVASVSCARVTLRAANLEGEVRT